MAASDPADTLTPDEASRLAEFARACKSATRVVALYPATHPAIQASLNRVTESAERLRAGGIAVLTVLPEDVQLDGRSAVKRDSALGELATLLHAHLIGELRIADALSGTAWHTFLSLLSRPAEDIRAEGGIERAWMSAGGGPIEIRQIDYTEVLRERAGGLDGGWDRIIANYLEGEFSALDDASMAALFDIAGDTSRFKDFTEQLVSKATEPGARGSKKVVLRVLQALANFVAAHHPEQLNRILNQISGVIPRLTPDLVLTLLTKGVAAEEEEECPASIFRTRSRRGSRNRRWPSSSRGRWLATRGRPPDWRKRFRPWSPTTSAASYSRWPSAKPPTFRLAARTSFRSCGRTRPNC
jgi:hypothetical protein